MSVNKAIIVGHLGGDPDIRYASSGSAIANLKVATTETWKDKNTNEKKENTEWHKVVFFGRLAEIAGEYLKKGSLVYIEGSIKTNKWQGEDGKDNYSTGIVGSSLQMLGSPNGGQGNNGSKGGSKGSSKGKSAPPKNEQVNWDEDIPF